MSHNSQSSISGKEHAYLAKWFPNKWGFKTHIYVNVCAERPVLCSLLSIVPQLVKQSWLCIVCLFCARHIQGCVQTISVVGPVFGYLLGSLCAKIYVDIGFVKMGEVKHSMQVVMWMVRMSRRLTSLACHPRLMCSCEWIWNNVCLIVGFRHTLYVHEFLLTHTFHRVMARFVLLVQNTFTHPFPHSSCHS